MNIEYGARRSGRTTRMLEMALPTATTDPRDLYVVGIDSQHVWNLRRQLEDLIVAVLPDPRRVTPENLHFISYELAKLQGLFNDPRPGEEPRGHHWVFDHFTNECLHARAGRTQAAASVAQPKERKALPYKTPLDLWRAFKGGAKFVLHYHGKTHNVTRMEPRERVVYVQPPGMPVKVYPDGSNCESAGTAIWLEEVAASSAPPAA